MILASRNDHIVSEIGIIAILFNLFPLSAFNSVCGGITLDSLMIHNKLIKIMLTKIILTK